MCVLLIKIILCLKEGEDDAEGEEDEDGEDEG